MKRRRPPFGRSVLQARVFVRRPSLSISRSLYRTSVCVCCNDGVWFALDALGRVLPYLPLPPPSFLLHHHKPPFEARKVSRPSPC